MLNKKNVILLTGAGGFIGKNLIEYFNGKYELLTPSSVELDLTDRLAVIKYMKNNPPSCIIHSAFKGVRITENASEDMIDVNVSMFENILEAMPEGCKVINIGSGAEYDKDHDLKKVKEKDFGEIVPKLPYGYAKYVISKEIEKLDNVLNLRVFSLYGKYEHLSRFPSDAIIHNIEKKPIIINRNVVFDYLYIDDLSKIIEYFIENKPPAKFINVAPTQSTDLINIAKIINEISEFKSEIIVKNPVLNYEYTGDNSLLREEIPDFKFTELKEGLKNLYDYYKKSENSIKD